MQWRTWIVAEVESEPDVRQRPSEPATDGWVSTDSYLVEASGWDSARRIHQLAIKYAPGANYSVAGSVSAPGPSDDFETLRFSLPSEDAEGVLGQLQVEPGVRRAWLEGPFPD